AIAVVLMALFALGQAMSLGLLAADPETRPVLDAIHGAEIISGGYPLGTVTIAVLGALLITGEYSTGMIRSTFAAAPTRLPVLAAKALALTALAGAVAVVSLALSWLVTFFLLDDYGLVPAVGDAQTWQVFSGVTYFLIASALFALGL